MNSEKVDTTIKQEWELFSKKKEHLWILKSPKIISTKMKDHDVLIAIYMNT